MSADSPTEAAAPEVAPAPHAEDNTTDKDSGAVQPPVAGEDEKVTAEESKDDDAAEAKVAEKQHGQRRQRTYDNGMLKTSAVARNQTRANSKYDPSLLETSDNPREIRGQVEFYFSDSNLPHDQFMWKETGEGANEPLPLSKIVAFGRMRRFQPYSAVVAALKESKFLNVTGPEGAELITRKVPYDPNVPRSKTEARSVYVKGFGDEEPSSQFDIEAFFAQYGSTNAVRLRRTVEKLFKGSVFVEFSDEETAKNFLALDPKPLWKGKHILEITSKKDYQDKKEKEISEGIVQPSESWGPSSGRGGGRGRGGRGNRNDRGRGRDRGDRGDRDPDDWRKRRDDDRANGFKNDSRGRGQKGNRGRQGDRGPRNNDRNREREEKDATNTEATEEAAKTNSDADNQKKRAREEDTTDEKPAKKVDTKTEATEETS